MTDQSTRDKGRNGEELALAYLQKKGYAILERNYRCRYGEIDLVAKNGSTIVFVEVKSRRSNAFGSPEEAVGIAKQKKLSIVALYYLMEKHLDDRFARFDVVTVMNAGKKPEIRIIRDAFDLIR
ncbi:MAG: YraN family protein [Syntrophaceae bacterium]|nr:YraN family protein [Syntrophaceae bacterium]